MSECDPRFVVRDNLVERPTFRSTAERNASVPVQHLGPVLARRC